MPRRTHPPRRPGTRKPYEIEQEITTDDIALGDTDAMALDLVRRRLASVVILDRKVRHAGRDTAGDADERAQAADLQKHGPSMPEFF